MAVSASRKVVDFNKKNGICPMDSCSSFVGSCLIIACLSFSLAVIVDEIRKSTVSSFSY